MFLRSLLLFYFIRMDANTVAEERKRRGTRISILTVFKQWNLTDQLKYFIRKPRARGVCPV